MAETPQPPASPTTILEASDEAVIVRVQCTDLNETHVNALRESLLAALETYRQPFIIDIAKVKFVPSLSIGVLVRIGNDFRSRKQRMILIGLQPMVRKVMAITQMDRILEIQDSVETALRTIRI